MDCLGSIETCKDSNGATTAVVQPSATWAAGPLQEMLITPAVATRLDYAHIQPGGGRVPLGDPLETRTHVPQMFINGRLVDLNNKHKRLYEKFVNRP